MPEILLEIGRISGKLDALSLQVAAQSAAIMPALDKQQQTTDKAIDPEKRELMYNGVLRILDWMDGVGGARGARQDILDLKNNKIRFVAFMAGACTVGSAVGYIICTLITFLHK